MTVAIAGNILRNNKDDMTQIEQALWVLLQSSLQRVAQMESVVIGAEPEPESELAYRDSDRYQMRGVS